MRTQKFTRSKQFFTPTKHVCRLIEQKQVRFPEKRPRQRQPHPPTARKSLGSSLLLLRRESKTGKNHCSSRFGLVGFDFLETLVDGLESFGAGGALVVSGRGFHGSGQLFFFLEQSFSFHISRKDRGKCRGIVANNLWV